MRIDAEARAALEELVERWSHEIDRGKYRQVTRDSCRDDLLSLLSRAESEPEGEEVVLTVPDSWKPGDVVVFKVEKML